ncbi:hypothetical protein PSHT_09209 [Puccinia striiformis]|uniref:Far11/STRP C-terminal domain-containing protein n=1 Tax=Puccinia striiformis TaxID=27350 RepID=A0A2S4VIB9_9BASI|nr:hypothetical protein PSHT_09209 [Puccinia striiformis]
MTSTKLSNPTIEDIDILRHREITSKAVSAILILTLKWFASRLSQSCRRLALTDFYFGNFKHHEISLLGSAVG